jgi:hypothetical protein
MSIYNDVKESLEHGVFNEIEPDKYYTLHGLWLPKTTPVVNKKNCIDKALKKIYGKDGLKPFSLSKNGRTEFKRLGKYK